MRPTAPRVPAWARRTLLATALAAAAQAAPAAEAYVAYDNFPGSGPIDATKWSSFERQRKLVGGTLNMVQRDWGGTSADTGAAGFSWTEELSAPGRVTQLKALVRVNALSITNCPNSFTTGGSRARLLGTLFNTGNPIPGNFIGDVLVQARIIRNGNSTDPEGVLRVQGTVLLCSSSDCNFGTTLYTADLGTATAGQQVSLAMEWVKASKRIIFRRDSLPVAEYTYSVSDAAGPGRPLMGLGTRMDLPNCLSGPRTTGYVDASFDGVSVNRSGKL